MEDNGLILYAGRNLDDIAANGLPPFIQDGVYQFGDKMPRKFQAGEVPVYTQAANTKFVYLGVLRKARIDRATRALSFQRFDEFPKPLLICDVQVDRKGLYSPNNGFGPLDFNYVDWWVPALVARRGQRQASHATTFWHVADVHAYAPCKTPCDHPPANPNDDACHNCIKARVIMQMAQQLIASPPDLLLLAGDLLEGLSYDEKKGTILDPLLDAARAQGVVIVGVTGQHDARSAALRKELEWSWLLDTGGTNGDAGVVVYAVGGRGKQRGVGADVNRLQSPPAGVPSILLCHLDPASLPRGERTAPRFSYYALADRHQLWIERLSKRSIAACPGHLFSYYDGCGKTWPTYYLQGAIDRDGAAKVAPVPLQSAAYGAPHTRQLYVPFEYRTASRGKLVYVNPPDRSVLEALDAPFELETLSNYRESRFPGAECLNLDRAVFPYRSNAELRHIVTAILAASPDDIFVSPSVGKYKARVKTVGRVISESRMEEYLRKIVQRAANGQTADNGATGRPRVRA